MITRELLALAASPEREARGDLARRLVDAFEIVRADAGAARAHYDAVLAALAARAQDDIKRELAVRFAGHPEAPATLMAQLASEAIDIARPVLAAGIHLDDDKLISLLASGREAHAAAIAAADHVRPRVAARIVSDGDLALVTILLANPGADIARTDFEALVLAARDDAALHGPLAQAPRLPLDLMVEMLEFVGRYIKATLTERISQADDAAMSEALSAVRQRFEPRPVERPHDFETAQRLVGSLRTGMGLTPARAVALLRDGLTTAFLLALADLAALDFDTVYRLWRARDVDSLVIALRAAHGDRAFAVTVAVLCVDDKIPAAVVGRQAGAAYQAMPLAAAERIAALWRARSGS